MDGYRQRTVNLDRTFLDGSKEGSVYEEPRERRKVLLLEIFSEEAKE